MTRSIQLSTACSAAVLVFCVGQNVHPAQAQTNEHPLLPPSVPESIAPQYYSRISFQDEYEYAGAAKQKLLDALNSKCLSAAARDAATADAERAIHQIEEWAKYHPDEAARSWAGYWRGPLEKYLALLKQKKKCVETGNPGITQPTPPQETTPPPTEGKHCLTAEEKKNKIIGLEFEITKTDVDRTILQKDISVVNETIESAKGQIETMNHFIKHPDEPKGEGNEDLDPRTVKADEEAKLRDAQLEKARIERELESNHDERVRLNNQLESLKEQGVCPDDRHSSKENSIDPCLVGTWQATSFKEGITSFTGGGTGFRVTFKSDGTEIVDYSSMQATRAGPIDTIVYTGTASARISTDKSVAKLEEMQKTGATLTLNAGGRHYAAMKIPSLGPGGLGSTRDNNHYECSKDSLEYQTSAARDQHANTTVQLKRLTPKE